LVLARNWGRLSADQQAEFVRLFKAHLALTYGRSIESYSNEKVEVVGERDEGHGDWTVKTKILRGGGNADVLVDYRLRQENDAWRIIDVVIERVSLVANFRSQFQDIMSSGGPAKLLDEEREDRPDAPVHAPALDREAIVVGRELLGDRLARREERHEGGIRRARHDVHLAGAAEVDVERPVGLAEREQHLHRVVAA